MGDLIYGVNTRTEIENIEEKGIARQMQIHSAGINNDVCPMCNNLMTEINRAFSINDMSKEICSSCATKESLELIASEKKVKIKLFNNHFAWIYSWLLSEFDLMTGINNRSDWIIRKAYEDFGVMLSSKEDLERFDLVVRIHHYIDKTDWLREKMRLEIKKIEGEKNR